MDHFQTRKALSEVYSSAKAQQSPDKKIPDSFIQNPSTEKIIENVEKCPILES